MRRLEPIPLGKEQKAAYPAQEASHNTNTERWSQNESLDPNPGPSSSETLPSSCHPSKYFAKLIHKTHFVCNQAFVLQLVPGFEQMSFQKK